MDLLLQRKPALDESVLGDLFVDGMRRYVTLERLSAMIPKGRYRVAITQSNRASRGQLWSPTPDHILPLICDVPGRAGIRIHALNDASESDGCIGVGMLQIGDRKIGQSRVALTVLTRAILDATALESAYLQIIDAPTERTQLA